MPDQEQNNNGNRSAAKNLWKTGLLLTGSALVGGLAVAFWHRRTIATIRQASAEPASTTVSRQPSLDDDVIY